MEPGRSNKKAKPSPKSKIWRWALISTFLTFFISFTVNFISKVALVSAKLSVAIIIVLLIILIGVLFDLIGTAVTAADEVPFHSMSARKVRGATKSIYLIRNAERVSNICNDIIGDICSVISGSMAGVIVVTLSVISDFPEFWMSIIFTSFIAALTVGAKAFGKGIAIAHAEKIIFAVGKILSVFDGGRKNGAKQLFSTKK